MVQFAPTFCRNDCLPATWLWIGVFRMVEIDHGDPCPAERGGGRDETRIWRRPRIDVRGKADVALGDVRDALDHLADGRGAPASARADRCINSPAAFAFEQHVAPYLGRGGGPP